MKTAMQELIKEFEGETNDDNWTNQERAIFKVCMTMAKSRLSKERQQIEDAYWEGGQDFPVNPETCKEYFNKTYKQ